MNYKITLVLLFIGFTTIGFSQEETEISENTYTYNKNKGKAYFYWGWNRAYYSNSDIEFKGKNYNFTMHDVEAVQKSSKVTFRNYLQLDRITIPQTNFRIGYYIKDHYQVSFGFDHMKYVVKRPQTVNVSGTINIDPSEGYTGNNGTYNNDPLYIDGNPVNPVFHFEHTDGLNYINIELARVDDLGEFLKLNPKKLQINLLEGIGIGGLYPKTNATVMGKPRHDEFHWSGYGASAKIGLGFVIFNHIQIQAEAKGGFINMPWMKTSIDGDTAKQKFWFFQHNITFGYVFQLFNNSKKNNKNLK